MENPLLFCQPEALPFISNTWRCRGWGLKGGWACLPEGARRRRAHRFFLMLTEFLLQVKHATNQIVMNCADIDIITASYAPEGDEGRIVFLFAGVFTCYSVPFLV